MATFIGRIQFSIDSGSELSLFGLVGVDAIINLKIV
jgi:hypothetical protein